MIPRYERNSKSVCGRIRNFLIRLPPGFTFFMKDHPTKTRQKMPIQLSGLPTVRKFDEYTSRYDRKFPAGLHNKRRKACIVPRADQPESSLFPNRAVERGAAFRDQRLSF